jgi:hypothetical protein
MNTFQTSTNHSRCRLLWVCVYFLAITLVMTWPLAAGLNQFVPGYPGDNLLFVWAIEWYQKSIFQLHTSPVIVPTLNYPEGYSLGYFQFSPATVFSALPLTMLFGPVAGYNAVVLSTFVLSGLGAYVWVYGLAASHRAGLVAGTAFAFCTYRMNHLGGHITLLGTQWIVFYFISLTSLLRSRIWSWRRVVVTAVCMVLMSATAPYYLYMSLVLSIPYVIGILALHSARARRVHTPEAPVGNNGPFTRLGIWAATRRSGVLSLIHLALDRTMWMRLVAAYLVAAPFILLAIAPYLQLRASGSFGAHTLEEALLYSASPTDFLVSMKSHLFWGSAMESLYRGENALYLGVVTLCLATLAFACRAQLVRQKNSIRLLAWTTLCATVLALGVGFHWSNAEVRIAVPKFLQSWWPFAETFIPLPGYILYRFLPFYGSMRVWMRYGVYVSLFVSVLAGIGVTWLVVRIRPRWRSVATLMILALVLLDSYRGPIEVTAAAPRPVDEWLTDQPGEGVVATFPFDEAWKSEQTYYAGTRDNPYLAGYFGVFRSAQYERLLPVLENFPDTDSVALLRSYDVQYALIDSDLYPDFAAVKDDAIELGLRLVYNDDDGNYVFELPSFMFRSTCPC